MSQKVCPEHLAVLKPRYLDREGGEGVQWNCPEAGCPYYEMEQPALTHSA